MKFIRLALLSLSATGFLAAPSLGSGIRKGEHDADKDLVAQSNIEAETGRLLQEEDEEAVVEMPLPGRPGPKPKPKPKPKPTPPMDVTADLAGCDCTTSDSEDILAAQNLILQSLGFSDPSSGFSNYFIIQKEIQKCVNLGIKILAHMKCGGCAEGEAPVLKINSKGMQLAGIKTYDCCCDSDTIKDIIKDQLMAILAATRIIDPRKKFSVNIFLGLVQTSKKSAILAIRGVVEDIYLTPKDIDDILKAVNLQATEVSDDLLEAGEVIEEVGETTNGDGSNEGSP